MIRPLRQADLRRVRAVFADVDGTITIDGQLTSTVLRAIEGLASRRVQLVLVSGRSSGWGECWIRQLPVAGVIVENGGLTYLRQGKRLKKVFAQRKPVRDKNRPRLIQLVAAAIDKVKGSRLSNDCLAREVDLAIDYAEDAALGPEGAKALERFLIAQRVTAVRSSVHVNCWLGHFDKRSAVREFLRSQWKARLRPVDPRYVYVGDSFNDAPMFGAFSLSVGVANVLDVVDRLEAAPKFVTRGREGHGFCELVDAIAGRAG